MSKERRMVSSFSTEQLYWIYEMTSMDRSILAIELDWRHHKRQIMSLDLHPLNNYAKKGSKR